MTKPEQSRWGLERVRVAVDHDDELGLLLRIDGTLVAVLVRLDAEYNGEHRGRWHLEAGFGRCAGLPPEPAGELAELLRWIAERLGQSPHGIDALLKDANVGS